MNNYLKVVFPEIETNIESINKNINGIELVLNEINNLKNKMNEGWNDTLFNSSEIFKTSLETNIIERIVENDTKVKKLVEAVQSSMSTYQENESKWQSLFNSTKL